MVCGKFVKTMKLLSHVPFIFYSTHDSTYVVFHNSIASYAVCIYGYVNRD